MEGWAVTQFEKGTTHLDHPSQLQFDFSSVVSEEEDLNVKAYNA